MNLYIRVSRIGGTHVDSRGGEVRGAELAEEHLLVPSRGARARHPDGLSHGRHRAAVERVVLVLRSPRRPEAIRREEGDRYGEDRERSKRSP